MTLYLAHVRFSVKLQLVGAAQMHRDLNKSHCLVFIPDRALLSALDMYTTWDYTVRNHSVICALPSTPHILDPIAPPLPKLCKLILKHTWHFSKFPQGGNLFGNFLAPNKPVGAKTDGRRGRQGCVYDDYVARCAFFVVYCSQFLIFFLLVHACKCHLVLSLLLSPFEFENVSPLLPPSVGHSNSKPTSSHGPGSKYKVLPKLKIVVKKKPQPCLPAAGWR